MRVPDGAIAFPAGLSAEYYRDYFADVGEQAASFLARS
jgi:hypothetical protein